MAIFVGMDNKKYYVDLRDTSLAAIALLSRKITMVGTLRLLVFVLGIIGVWYLWGNVVAATVVGFVALAVFLVLIKVHEHYFSKRELENARRDIAIDNLNRLNLDLSKCRSGKEFINPRHPYTYDLDIFGNNSLYSLLDTTSTPAGAKLLAEWLINPLLVSADVVKRQEAIKELALTSDFRTDFRSFGNISVDEDKKVSTITDLSNFKVSAFIRVSAIVYPILMVLSIAFAYFDIITSSIVGLLFVLGLILAGSAIKSTSQKHKEINDTVASLSQFHSLITLVEKHDFKSDILKKLRHKFLTDTGTASEAAHSLSRILTNFDQRYNAIAFIVLNGFMLWDFIQLSSAYKWIQKYESNLPQWSSALAEIDALSALATYAFNNQDYIYPEVSKDGIIMEAVELGHPMIPGSKCVCNDVYPMRDGTFRIVTGANMAGKSTYLRTVGINFILAMIGAPVFAEKMIFTPTSLLTGLRTTDSLQDNESYFFAELSRLQSIIQRAEKGERMMVILDEILKGTNSTDKQKGSLALVERLISMKVAGLIATHDLVLGSLADKFPDNINNFSFEATIQDDTLKFSYKGHRGIAQNMNATYLMQKMGIIK